MKFVKIMMGTALMMSSFTAFGASRMAVAPPAGSNVPVSGSIAVPGATTATFTNPAGLIGNEGGRLSLQVGSPKPMDDPNYRALLLAGNGIFGLSAGVDYLMPSGSGSDQGWAVYGLAINLSPLNLTLGAAGRSGIKTAEGTNFNVGLLFHPMSSVTIGATAMGVKSEPDNYGLGLGLELLDGVDIVADAGFERDFKNPEFKPGLRLSNGFAGLSVSYGTGATAQFADDFSGAAYLRVGANSELEFIYNHGGDLPKYYASLSFGF